MIPRNSAGPDPESDPTHGKMNPKVADTSLAAAEEGIESESSLTSTSWTTEDAMALWLEDLWRTKGN